MSGGSSGFAFDPIGWLKAGLFQGATWVFNGIARLTGYSDYDEVCEVMDKLVFETGDLAARNHVLREQVASLQDRLSNPQEDR